MPRQARIDAPGALHHIIIRGIERRNIFKDNTDRESFLDRLGAVLSDATTSCYAWSLMSNHVHLLLRTGTAPIATVMRRLLTGHAVTFNRRHRRHGQLFQNRYKSILCQEDAYLLELVRYTHLNPLRASIVGDLEQLDSYPYAGHSALMGRKRRSWQDSRYILEHFDLKTKVARRRYRQYVEEGVAEGRRPELVGGGLIRSLGGWSKVKELREGGERLKGDERILGDSDFVKEVLEFSGEKLERTYQLKVQGYGRDELARRAASLFGLEAEVIFTPGKYRSAVQARSLFCYWAVRELGETATALAKELRLTQAAVSISVKRGEKIARERGFVLLEK